MIQLVDVVKEYKKIKKEIDDAIFKVINSGSFVSGKFIIDFENNFANYCGVKYGVALSSGSSALDLSLMALGIGNGDGVITTPFTFIATTEAITHSGAKIIFADIDPDTYTISPYEIKKVITKKTNWCKPKAIIPVHLFGHPCAMDEIMEIAREYNLFVIEDAAQSHGAEYKGKKVGSFGTVSCFSFYPSKNLGAYGHCGMAITNDENIAKKIRLLSNHGREEKYEHFNEGYNYRPDAIQTAILNVKLKYLDDWNENRRKNVRIYNQLLKDLPVITPKEADNVKHVYHLYVIRVSNRDGLLNYLRKKGIMADVHYPLPLHLQPAYKYLGYKSGAFPISEKLSSECLSLPMYPELTEEEIKFIVDEIRNFITKCA